MFAHARTSAHVIFVTLPLRMGREKETCRALLFAPRNNVQVWIQHMPRYWWPFFPWAVCKGYSFTSPLTNGNVPKTYRHTYKPIHARMRLPILQKPFARLTLHGLHDSDAPFTIDWFWLPIFRTNLVRGFWNKEMKIQNKGAVCSLIYQSTP